ncbi:H-NS family nucleoid-associated regulatory protein [Pseudoxanthomonas sp. Root630]|uniref:H-NS family nucleoid-associated regulatory protein n=1 Tax=Pseudoxanthomonas sp. Root630 TaxID=1736574 RepID=UPI0007039E80|nr:H-NS family nucleoid-associated regulatory protein [Pseudoxanthomonas sp. Root630]KRA50252.1 histone-like nucleoid-structuring protein [Pseudoxanthomonas sp. Root630]
MSKPTLDSIATAKAKLEEELRKLEQQEAQLRQQQAADAFAEVMNLLGQYGQHFNAKQKAEIVSAVGASTLTRVRKPTSQQEVAPKYWLPHTQETWTGRGRPPRAFTAWEGTAAYKEWKAKHPNEKFPKYPG